MNQRDELERYAWRQAHLLVSPACDRDDAVQEAMLAVWLVGPQTTSYLQGVVFKRVADFARTRRHTGHDRKKNQAVDVLRRQTWIDPRGEGLPDHEVDAMFGSTSSAESDPTRYDQLYTAVRSLAPRHRELIYRRFWLDAQGSGNLSSTWTNTVRPKLRVLLSA